MIKEVTWCNAYSKEKGWNVWIISKNNAELFFKKVKFSVILLHKTKNIYTQAYYMLLRDKYTHTHLQIYIKYEKQKIVLWTHDNWVTGLKGDFSFICRLEVNMIEYCLFLSVRHVRICYSVYFLGNFMVAKQFKRRGPDFMGWVTRE